MKLNTRRTILVGFAFLAICSFWQMYNSVVPLILTKTFALNEAFSGAIMAADNVLAIFLLPFFGALSDRCSSRLGRRMPFILYGTLAAVVLMMFLPVLTDSYYAAPQPWKKAAFVGVLACLLVAMGTYRSPAVALMPDLTPKPLRSKGNAVINLMGALGGILYLLIASVLYSSRRIGDREHVSYTLLFAVVAGIMLLALAILLLTINERKLLAEMREERAEGPEKETAAGPGSREKLPRDVRRSLLFLLSSIALWYFGYNAMETWFTTYADRVWHMAYGDAAMCMTVATGGAIVSYIPIGILASRIGRRKTILMGTVVLSSCFFLCFLLTLLRSSFSPVLYGLFALLGVSWAAINVNSLPMVVEMCSEAEVGRYTGFYYTFSMAAQIVTPVLAGALLKNLSYLSLFPYAAFFVALSFCTMLFVRHGDSRIEARRGLEAFDTSD